jgi:hypothetical protein
MAKAKAKVHTSKIKEEKSSATTARKKKRKAAEMTTTEALNAAQKEQVDNFRMVTRSSEQCAINWMGKADWASGSALQMYFQHAQAVCTAVDLTDETDTDEEDTNTGGLGESALILNRWVSLRFPVWLSLATNHLA